MIIQGNIAVNLLSGAANIAGVDFNGTTGLGYGFVEIGAVPERMTFVHEFGHILGGEHQKCQNGNRPRGCVTILPLAQHAHRFRIGVFPNRRQKRTAIWSGPLKSRHEVLNFSNPNVKVNGASTGVAGEKDNAARIRSYACTVSGFVTGGDLPLSTTIVNYENEGDLNACPCETVGAFANINGGAPGSHSFEWRISSDGINWGGIVSTSESYNIGLSCTPGVNTHIWLKVTDSAGTESNTFRIATPVITDRCDIRSHDEDNLPYEETNFSISELYPNPTKKKVNLEVEFSEEQELRIDILDENSRYLGGLVHSSFEKGKHQFEFDTNVYPSGVYYIRLNTGNLSIVEKLIILK